MHELYAQAYQQLASISAVLGGLAFTGAIALLGSAATKSGEPIDRAAKWTVASALASAVLMILAALTWSLMAADIFRAVAHRNIPEANAVAQLNVTPSLALLAGILLFFTSIGASGWIASPRMGKLTVGFACFGGVGLVLLILSFAG